MNGGFKKLKIHENGKYLDTVEEFYPTKTK